VVENATTLIHQIVLYSYVGLVVWAAVNDYREWTIPNRICIALVGLYPAYVLSSPEQVHWVAALVVAEAVFVVGLGLFVFRVMGGGDVKLMAAVALWAGPEHIFTFLFVTSLAGGALSLLMLPRLLPMRPRAAGTARLAFLGVHVPYGIAVAAGALLVGGRLIVGATS